MYYAVTYDITDDRRRRQIAKTLKDFGTRIQYSVFVCQTDRRAYLRLQNRLKKYIDTSEDSLVFCICAMHASIKSKTLGCQIGWLIILILFNLQVSLWYNAKVLMGGREKVLNSMVAGLFIQIPIEA